MAQYKHDRFFKFYVQAFTQESQREIALKMLQENIQLETIARITELSIDKLQQLRSNS